MTENYGKWLLRLVDAASEDEMWRVFASMEPPDDPVTKAQLREQLIKVFKARKISAPAKTADAWLYPKKPPRQGEASGEREPRAQVHKTPPLALETNILDRLVDELGALGHVGEDRACKLVYLSATSRLLTQIVSLVAKGPSAAGKSATVDRVLAFFPEEALLRLSGMSERYLVYDEEPIKHRMLVLHEASGMSGEYASYLIRTLLSEGALRHGTVEVTGDGLRAIKIDREGPAGLITTTTQVNLHSENETRLMSIPIDDTRAQTARVMAAIAKGNGRVVDYEPWHQLQFWLNDGERRVTVPYARVLANLVPPIAVRLRRDFGAVLGLTRAHALLHRANREQDEAGYIIATIDDYAVIRNLVHDVLSDTLGAQVSKVTRETVQAVAELTGGKPGRYATTLQLVKILKLDRSALTRRINRAIDQGYLVNDEDRPKKPRKLRLGDPLPDDVDILPSIDALEAALATTASS